MAVKLQRYRLRKLRELQTQVKRLLLREALKALEGGTFDTAAIHLEVMSLYQALEDDITEKVRDRERGIVAKALDKIGARINRDYKRLIWRLADGGLVQGESLLSFTVPEIRLSSDIWGDASERVLSVIGRGRAMGRNAAEIAGDLETLIKYKDGGKRVIGRWRQMIPVMTADGTVSPSKAREVWAREYLEFFGPDDANDPGYIAYGSPEAKEILKTPEAQFYLDAQMGALPPAHEEYARRLGDAGLDYRAMRVIRTESAKIFNERLNEQAEGIAGTGKVKRVLSQHRDAWKCDCVRAKDWINAGGGKAPSEIPDDWKVPLHPNCECRNEPIFLTTDELADRIIQQFARK